MAVDLSSLDAKIRKFQRLKELLSDPETRELLADPEIRVLIQQTVRSNGSLEHRDEPSNGKPQKTLREGTLLADVFEATKDVPERFKVKDVLNAMTGVGYSFSAKKPEIAVNSALRKLAKHYHLLKLVKKGAGRKPHIFARAEQPN